MWPARAFGRFCRFGSELGLFFVNSYVLRRMFLNDKLDFGRSCRFRNDRARICRKFENVAVRRAKCFINLPLRADHISK